MRRSWVMGSLVLVLVAASCGSDDSTAGTGATGGGAGSTTGGTGGGAGVGGSATGGTAGATPDASSPGFEADPGFSVSGALAHGSTITITDAQKRFGTRAHPAPWLWDTVSQQYLAGQAQDAYAGIADGQAVNESIWTDQGIYQGWDTPEHHMKLTTSKPMRHARATAQYGNYAANASDPNPYSKLARPKWPSGWGAQDNAQMYLSWWQRVSGTNPGYPQDSNGNGGEDKPLRFGDTDNAGLGEFDITVAGLTANTTGFGNVKSWGSLPDPGDSWHRIELFVDRVAGIADLYTDGKLGVGSSWTVNPGTGGSFEFRPANEYLFVSPGVSGTDLDTSSWKNVTVHWLGFDDGGTTQQFAPGRNVEVSEIYVDVTRARVELSTASDWTHAPDAVRASEVQGHLTSWSDGQIEVELNQGAFASLGGLYVWVITDAGEALRIGKLQ
jgi:hypothetical protein